MFQIPGLNDSLRFLVLELRKQLQLVATFVQTGELAYATSALKRRDYVDNYHVHLLNKLTQYFIDHPQDNQNAEFYSYSHLSYSLREMSTNLDEVVFHTRQLKHFKLIQKKPVFKSIDLMMKGLDLIQPAMQSPDLAVAIEICRLKVNIDQHADKLLQRQAERLKKGRRIDDLMRANFIVQDMGRLGDSLLHIGEAIISAKLGQQIEIQRYRSLEATLNAMDIDTEDLSIHPLGETKSGCTISGVKHSEHEQDEIIAVFKQGDKTKLAEEKQSIETWHEKFPGIAPKLYSYHRSGDKAALLYEYLEGDTLDKLLVRQKREQIQHALDALFALLENIWQNTQIEATRSAHFMRQLKKRLHDIYQVHPEFEVSRTRIGDIEQDTLENLIGRALKLESQLTVPPAVYIHGDFNLDNILFDPQDNSISFIDLHRSEYLDYVQDLSVLMVSHYRLMNFDPEVRKLIAHSMERIYDFGSHYAEQHQDKDYHLRMALGLARSFLTSTRFVLDQEHAKSMHFRGRYLLEQILNLNESQQLEYRVPKELFRD